MRLFECLPSRPHAKRWFPPTAAVARTAACVAIGMVRLAREPFRCPGRAKGAAFLLLAALAACAGDETQPLTFARFPPVETAPAGLPTFALGDSFRFTNPDETWIVTDIAHGLIRWRSTRGGRKTTAFDPFLPALQWSAKDGKGSKGSNGGVERLIGWKENLFPLKGGKKIAFQTERRLEGQAKATPFLWKCYVGNPRKVTVEAGSFPAYPVFCRRSDDFTLQSFYAPAVNGMLLIETRQRPAKARIRELAAFTPGPEKRIAAPDIPALPRGWAVAPATPPAPAPVPEKQMPVVAKPAPATPPAARAEPTTTTKAAPPRGPKIVMAPQPKAPVPKRAETPPPAPQAVPSPGPKIVAPSPAVTPLGPPTRKADKDAAATLSRPSVAPAIPGGSAVATAPDAEPKNDRPATGRKGPDATRGPAASFGVQIASFSQQANAAAAWTHYRKQLRPLLDDTPHLLRRVDLGPSKGVFHRLFAGPYRTRAEAATLCRSIRERGGTCLVTRVGG